MINSFRQMCCKEKNSGEDKQLALAYKLMKNETVLQQITKPFVCDRHQLSLCR